MQLSFIQFGCSITIWNVIVSNLSNFHHYVCICCRKEIQASAPWFPPYHPTVPPWWRHQCTTSPLHTCTQRLHQPSHFSTRLACTTRWFRHRPRCIPIPTSWHFDKPPQFTRNTLILLLKNLCSRDASGSRFMPELKTQSISPDDSRRPESSLSDLRLKAKEYESAVGMQYMACPPFFWNSPYSLYHRWMIFPKMVVTLDKWRTNKFRVYRNTFLPVGL